MRSLGSKLANAATFFFGFFLDWTHSAVTLHVCGLYRAPYRPIPVPCQRLFRRRHSPTVSRERTQRPRSDFDFPYNALDSTVAGKIGVSGGYIERTTVGTARAWMPLMCPVPQLRAGSLVLLQMQLQLELVSFFYVS